MSGRTTINQASLTGEAVPAEVARIAVVLAVKPGLPRGTTFGVFAAIRAWLADAAGQPVSLFPLPLASRGETAMILSDLYRHRGQWKFRAVGQGRSHLRLRNSCRVRPLSNRSFGCGSSPHCGPFRA